MVFPQQTPLVYVDPPTVTGLAPSQNFNISVKVSNVTELYGFDIKFRWDPAVLDYVGHTAKVPVETYPDGVLYETIIPLKDDVNATAGTYWLAATSLWPAASFNGTGIFFEMTFHVKAIGRTILEIYSSSLAHVSGNPIIHNVEHGFFTNYVPTPADIYVDPNKVIDANLTPCNNFTVDVNLNGVVDLELLEFWLQYNTTVLDINATANPILQPSVTVEIFEAEGRMRLTASLSPSITGDFNLATVTFHVEATGESALDLYNVTLVDDWGDPIPYEEPGDGFFSNVLKARLFVDPAELIDPLLTPGSEFSIEIKVEDVIDLYGYRFNLSYDTMVLTCLGAVISPPTNDTYFTTEIEIVDEAGYIVVNVTYHHPAEPITLLSATTVVTIYFQVQSFGCTVLDLHDTRLVDQFGDPIAHDVEDGFFCTLVADVAIVSVEPSRNTTYSLGCWTIVNVTVVAANVGDTTETFNVTAYYGNNTIGTLPVIDLLPGQNTTLTFIWNTTGLEPCSNFAMSAEASPVPYELNLTNNIMINGFVKIKIVGDVNGDGAVDIFDLVLAADAYGSVIGDPDYNPEADVAPNCGIVDIFDIVTITSRYGQSC